MQLVAISIALMGLIMVFFGMKWIIFAFKGKEIVQFSLGERKKEFELTKAGRYGVFIVGTKYLKTTGDFSAKSGTREPSNG